MAVPGEAALLMAVLALMRVDESRARRQARPWPEQPERDSKSL